MHLSRILLATAVLVAPAGAAAQAAGGGDAPQSAAPSSRLTVSGSAAILSDYRLRGVSQSDGKPAIQGGLSIVDASGVYVGTWASSLAGWGTFGGANMELDLIGGYRTKLGGGTLDVGLTWYLYPGGAAKTDYAEPFAKLSGSAGPATLTAGVAYAPRQQAIGKWYDSGASAARGIYDHPGAADDNLYLWGDGAIAIRGTPVTAKAHVGHSWGQDGLGPNATAVTPTGEYWDWSLGADTAWRNLTLGLSWVDTDIGATRSVYLRPSFSKGQDGTGSIAGSTLLASLTAAF